MKSVRMEIFGFLCKTSILLFLRFMWNCTLSIVLNVERKNVLRENKRAKKEGGILLDIFRY